MQPEFFGILAERIEANNFTEKQLNDAINHVIDTFQYKELNIADIIRFDRRIKLYTWEEAYCLHNAIPHPDLVQRKINGVIYYVLKKDIL